MVNGSVFETWVQRFGTRVGGAGTGYSATVIVMIYHPIAARVLRTAGLVLLTAVAAVLSGAQPAAAIAHGDAVSAGRYAFAVRLTMVGIPEEGGGSRDSWCSGALIASRWVITAGHCFRDENGERVSRPVADRTTAVFRSEPGGRAGRPAAVVAVHQQPDTDIALAELDRDITGVVPLRIGRTAPDVGEVVRLTGYGLTGDDASAPDGLRTGRFAVESTGDTRIGVAGRSPQRDTSACLHDSGGPYFREPANREPELVAVVSTGPSCPHTGPDMASRIDTVADWITATTSGTPSSRPTVWWVAAGTVLLMVAVVVVAWRSRKFRKSPTV